MRLIDADIAIEKLHEYVGKMESDIYYGSNLGVPEDCIRVAIDNTPTVEAEPVRHGYWKMFNSCVWGEYKFQCSECGEYYWESKSFPDRAHFCQCCGAKMDGEQK